MTIANLMAFVRWKANVDPNVPYDNTTLLPLVNALKNDIAQAIAQRNPNYFGQTSITATISGQQAYQKPDDFLILKRMDISYTNTSIGSYYPARVVSLAEMMYGEDWFAANSSPSSPLIREDGNYYFIYPIPTLIQAGTMFLKIWYVPLPPDFTDLSLTTDIKSITGIGASFHKLLGLMLINEIKGKQNILNDLQVQQKNQELIDDLVPAAIGGTPSTMMIGLPADGNLQF